MPPPPQSLPPFPCQPTTPVARSLLDPDLDRGKGATPLAGDEYPGVRAPPCFFLLVKLSSLLISIPCSFSSGALRCHVQRNEVPRFPASMAPGATAGHLHAKHPAGDHHGAKAGSSSSPWLPRSPAHLRQGAGHPRPPPHLSAASGAPMAAHRRLT